MKLFTWIFLLFFCIMPSISNAGASENHFASDSASGETSLSDIFKKGVFFLNIRTRYEWADKDSLDSSVAGTIRTRLGYQTDSSRKISGLVEIENTISLDESAYDAYPGPQGEPGHTLIPDPVNLELNRLQLSYKGSIGNLVAGRQRIILDNARFVGNVGWRQNEQTFDSVTLRNNSINGLSLFYGYIDQANRIFGEHADSEVQRRFEMDSHLFNIQYEGCPFGKIGSYAYLIRVENAAANSSDTFGAFFDGAYEPAQNLKLSYRAEYAHQKDNSESPAGSSFDLDYYHLKFNTIWKSFNAGAGFEGLEGNGLRGFSTPLATGHKFNGWADVFLGTPGAGLEDIYVSAKMTLQNNITLGVVYHDFQSWKGDADYGKELDVVSTWKINKHFKMTAKYADFNADSAAFSDIQKFWIQLDITY